MKYDAIVVGGGIAGLTASTYLTKAGYSTLLCEQQHSCGGLVSTFERDGFFYDGGIRATENSGVLFPMLKQLGIEIDFIKNHVTLGIENTVLRIEGNEAVESYQSLLSSLFPDDQVVTQDVEPRSVVNTVRVSDRSASVFKQMQCQTVKEFRRTLFK